MRPLLALFLALGTFVGCDEPYADDPAIDPEAPVVHLWSPARGAALGARETVVVAGAVEDDSPIRELRVAGRLVPLATDGTFEVEVPVSGAGTDLITVTATDADGNVGEQTRAVSAGPSSPIDVIIREAMAVAISDTAFEAVGNHVAATLANADLGAWIAPRNPVLRKGAPDGPDCLYGDVSIGALDVGAASIQLAPSTLGLALTAELVGVRVPMRLDYAALCVDGSSEALATADKVVVTGRFTFAIRNGRFAIGLADARVRLEGLSLSLGGLPGQVVNLLDLGTSLGPVLAQVVERLAVPALSGALAGVDGTATAEVFGETIDIALAPTALSFSPVDAMARLDASSLARGAAPGASFVLVPNAPLAVRPDAGLQLAVSDDAVNQLLASFWAAGGMDATVELTTGDYAGLGALYDSVRLRSLLPLSVRAEGGAGAKLVAPELVVSFLKQGEVVTELAINGALPLGVERTGDGALRLVSIAPDVKVDLARDGVAGGNPLAKRQLEVLTSFALSRLTNVATGILGALPLPRSPGARISDARVESRGGYLVFDVAVAAP